MKVIVKKLAEVDFKFIELILPVCYGEEDIPNDFPLRRGDMWQAIVDLDTKQVLDWPVGKEGRLAMKVTDSGVYILLDAERKELARR